jgi:hypothetical protein
MASKESEAKPVMAKSAKKSSLCVNSIIAGETRARDGATFN